jgi:hypothetical protein
LKTCSTPGRSGKPSRVSVIGPIRANTSRIPVHGSGKVPARDSSVNLRDLLDSPAGAFGILINK